MPKPRGRPRTGTTPMRYLRINDSDWATIVTAAKLRGVNTSEYIRQRTLASARRDVRKIKVR